MALTTIPSSPSVLYGSGSGESYGFAPGTTYVFGGGGNDNFLASTSYTALYGGSVQDYAFTVSIGDGGNEFSSLRIFESDRQMVSTVMREKAHWDSDLIQIRSPQTKSWIFDPLQTLGTLFLLHLIIYQQQL